MRTPADHRAFAEAVVAAAYTPADHPAPELSDRQLEVIGRDLFPEVRRAVESARLIYPLDGVPR